MGKRFNDSIVFCLSEFGKNVTLENFEGPSVTFKSSGALYTVQVNIFCEVMHRMLAEDQWSQALKICRRCQVKSPRILGDKRRLTFTKSPNTNTSSNLADLLFIFSTFYFIYFRTLHYGLP